MAPVTGSQTPTPAAGVVLAGGRSTRMGRPKAWLPWRGTTLLAQISQVLRTAVDGPVVVVRAPGQRLPALPTGVEVRDDFEEGVGPLLGLRTGLAAVAGRAEVAFVCATDMAHLQPAFVRRVLAGFAAAGAGPQAEVVLPVVAGVAQPLAAGYRTDLVARVDALLADGVRAVTAVAGVARVVRLDDQALLADPELRAADPLLASVQGLNRPADYEQARLAEASAGMASAPDLPTEGPAP